MKEDFKFNESNTEEGTNTEEVNKKFTLIIVVAVAIFFGLTIFIILSLIYSKNNRENNKPIELNIEEKQVRTLYNMVTYKKLGERTNKFMTESNITIDNFSNYEKYECALSLTKKTDFKLTGNKDNNTYEYYIDKNVLNHYMELYFGKGVNYSTNSSITNTYNFMIDGKNTGTLTYSPDDARYKIYFNSYKEETPDIMENKRFYSKLYKAEKIHDEINLYEKIVYTKCSKNNTNTYNCILYRDYDRTIQIEELKGIEEDSTIKFDEIKEGNEIVYTFKEDLEGNYYFYSSKTNK